MRLSAKALICLALLTLGMFAAAARPMTASAATPCWKTLLNDWYDGRIDGTYQLHCYQDALKHLPSDVDTYSSARADIERALQSAREAAKKSGSALSATTLLKPGSANTVIGKHSHTVVITQPPSRQQGKGLAKLADKIDPGGPSSLPLPLLVLGGLALALLAAGAIGLIVKRRQDRRPGA